MGLKGLWLIIINVARWVHSVLSYNSLLCKGPEPQQTHPANYILIFTLTYPPPLHPLVISARIFLTVLAIGSSPSGCL